MKNGSAAQYQRLREAYDLAFRSWTAATQAGAGVEQAEFKYHLQRDALFAFIKEIDLKEHRHAAVERLAYSFWERAGRPGGTAEADWYRAEAVVDALSLNAAAHGDGLTKSICRESLIAAAFARRGEMQGVRAR